MATGNDQHPKAAAAGSRCRPSNEANERVLRGSTSWEQRLAANLLNVSYKTLLQRI